MLSCKRDLFNHQNLLTEQNPYVCEHSHKVFSQESHLNSHLLIHTAEKPFNCSTCQKGFTRKSYLNAHQRVHTREKPYVCVVCQKGFSQVTALFGHLLIHTGDKPHICEICSKQYRQKRSLSSHLLTHTGEKPYACDYCQESFSQRRYLNRHVFQHTFFSEPFQDIGFTPIVCHVCQKSFSCKFSLNQHLFTHMKKKYSIHHKPSHEETADNPLPQTREKLFICKQCQQVFSEKAKLFRHIDTHAKEKPTMWDVCQKRLSQKKYSLHHKSSDEGTVKKHLSQTRSKTFICNVCQQVFIEKAKYIQHINTHAKEKPNMWDACKKILSQKRCLIEPVSDT